MKPPSPGQLPLFPALDGSGKEEPARPGQWRVEDQQPLFSPTRPPPVRLDAGPEAARLAARLATGPHAGIRMGSSSWTFPGWPVWGARYAMERLVDEGLRAYATHPLFRTVGVDRTWYRPIPASEYASMVAQVPADFSFLVKAHEDVTSARFPRHPRYGARAGERNPRFLEIGYAMEEVVGPFIEGMADGVLLFPFSPQALPRNFPDLLGRFLEKLPRGPWRYAVEVRNADALTPAYADALEANGVLPALVGWAGMPSVVEQARRTRALTRPERVVRWMLHPGLVYEEAKGSYAPFNALCAPDPEGREAVVEVLRGAKAAWVVVNNKAEGCAPLSITALAERLVNGPHA